MTTADQRNQNNEMRNILINFRRRNSVRISISRLLDNYIERIIQILYLFFFGRSRHFFGNFIHINGIFHLDLFRNHSILNKIHDWFILVTCICFSAAILPWFC